MSPILQTLANGSAYGYRTLAAAGAAPSFESIATFTPNNTTNTYTFSSIPGTYKNLQLRMNTTGSLQNQIILPSIHEFFIIQTQPPLLCWAIVLQKAQ
jgi:hypothetical protein